MSTSSASSSSKPSGGWQPPTLEEMQAMLPQYEFVSLLGRGGMGAVFKAVQVTLDRPVAIKVLPVDLVADDDSQFAERFQNEARTMAKMNHPAIVNVYDFGETNTGLLYIVMEFIDGTDVAQMIATQGKLPEDYALSITAHVSDALNYAHTQGIVHRDIKPANILINMEGAVKVADFGLAKANDPSQSGITKTNMAMGTPDFVAPEAFIPGVPLDGRADLYAMGVMLYQMLTGEIPRGIWALPGQKLGTDPRFDAIITKAMQTDREHRYQSAMDLRRDLDTILTLPRAALEAQQQAEVAARATQAQRQAASGPQSRPVSAPDPVEVPPPVKKSSLGPVIGIAATVLLIAGMVYVLQPPAKQPAPVTAAADFKPSDAGAPAPTPVAAGTTDRAVFSDFAPTAQWRDELAGTGSWGPAWQLAGNEMHVVESKNAMRVFADLRQDSALRVRFRSQSDAAWLDLIQRLNKVGVGPRYVITLWTKENLGGSLDVLPLKKDGERRTLAPLKSQPPLGTGTEHTAELYAIGDRLSFFFDGQLLGEVQDSTFSEGYPAVYASHGIELIRVETAVLDRQNSEPPPTEVLVFGGNRYQFSPEKLTWEEAKAKAAAAGGHLATITSKEENQWVWDTFVTKLPGSLSLWLGGTKNNPTQTWTWITGEPFAFTAWGEREPNMNPDEIALCFSRQSKGWGDIRTNGIGAADRRGGYLIEWDDDDGSQPMPTAAMPAPVATIAPAPAPSPSPVVKAPNDSTGWTNLLASVDVGKNTLAGQWRIEGGELHCPDDPASHRTVEIPVEKIPVNYDLRCRLTRTRPGAALFFALRQGETGAGAVIIDSWTANKAKPNEMSAVLVQARGEGGEAIRDNRFFQPGQRRELIFQVREDGFKAFLDGEELLKWKGSWSSLSQGDNSFLPPRDGGPLFALGVCGGEVVFHSLELREVDVIAEHKAAMLAADPQLARLESGFRSRYDNDAQKPFLAALAALNQSYISNGIAKARAAAQAKGGLKEIVALDDEKARVEKGEGVPAEDPADTPDSLKALRGTYRAVLAKHTAERDAKTVPLYDLYLNALDAYVAELTKANKLDDARNVQALRANIATQRPQTSAASVATQKPTTPTPAASAPPTKPAAPTGSTWRIAAEFLVSNGGSFVAFKNGVNSQVLTAKDIPAGRFDIIELNLDRLNSVMPPLKTPDMAALNGLRDLRRVNIRPAQPGLDDAAFAFLADNDELNWLNLEGVPDVTDALLPHLASAKKLDYLAIQYATKFTGRGLDQIAGAASITTLETLTCGITDEGLRAISTFKKLQTFRTNSPDITTAGFATLTSLKTLTSLTLSGTAFDDEAAGFVSSMTGLTNLDLGGTKITDAGLAKLKTLKKLISLNLGGTTVTPEAAAEFQKAMPQCRVNR